MNTKLIIGAVILVVVGGGWYVYSKNNSEYGNVAGIETSKSDVVNISETQNAVDTNKITMAEVEKHNSEASCYTVIRGGVYDVTSYINQHPGGSEKVLSGCGKDSTDAFTRKHGGKEKPEAKLATFKIGILSN